MKTLFATTAAAVLLSAGSAFAAAHAMADSVTAADQDVSNGIVSADIRADPEGMLRSLCDAIGLPFDPAMLSWRAGGHPADGAWAPHWYGAVHASTGFAAAEGPLPDLAGPAVDLCRRALPHYDRLRALALKKI